MTGCNLDIDESSTELKRKDNDGKEVSYNPPRYEYSYDFYITIFATIPIRRNALPDQLQFRGHFAAAWNASWHDVPV